MPEQKSPAAELVAAAEAFAAELLAFGKLAEAVRKLPLSSQKALQRAGRVYQEIAECEGRLGHAAQAMLGAIGVARQRQQEQAEAIQACGEEIRARSEAAAALLQRYVALGEDAARLNGMAQEVIKARQEVARAEDPEVRRALLALLQQLSEVVGGAQELTEDARKAGFEDIAREVDALRQQLGAARERIAGLSPIEGHIAQA